MTGLGGCQKEWKWVVVKDGKQWTWMWQIVQDGIQREDPTPCEGTNEKTQHPVKEQTR